MITGAIISHGISAVVGAVIGIFIYRNNTKAISKVADKVDDVWDEKIKKD